LTYISLIAVAGAAWVVAREESIRDNGYIVYEAGLQAGARAAAFFLLAISALAVASHRTRGTVRWLLPRPVSRAAFVIGQAAAHALLALLLLAAAVLPAWAAAAPFGFGDVVTAVEGDEDDAAFHYIEEEAIEPEFTAAAMRGRAVQATLLLLPAFLAAAGLGLFVSSLLASAAGAVILAVAIALPLVYLPEVLGLSADTARALPFRAAMDFLDQLREFGRHFNTAEWPGYGATGWGGALAACIGLPALAALLFGLLDITE